MGIQAPWVKREYNGYSTTVHFSAPVSVNEYAVVLKGLLRVCAIACVARESWAAQRFPESPRQRKVSVRRLHVREIRRGSRSIRKDERPREEGC